MKKRNGGWTSYLKVKAGRQVLWFTLALAAASLLAVGITFSLEGRPGRHIDGAEIARLEAKGVEEAPSSYFISGFIRKNGGVVTNPHGLDLSQFLVLKGIDDGSSACEYYRTIGAIQEDCDDLIPDADGFFFPRRAALVPVGIKLDCSPLVDFPTIPCVDWKEMNGLNDPAGRVDAFYFNAVDLALARAMHGKTVTLPRSGVKNTAYYVCNNSILLGPTGPVDIEDEAAACVAFDYSTARGFTRLYVFKPFEFLNELRCPRKPPARCRVLALAGSAKLDNAGEKFVPGLCKACHGSNFFHETGFSSNRFPGLGDNEKTGDIGVKFLPFDLDNFDYNVGVSRSAQEGKFKQLNEMIPETNRTPVVAQLIDGWYCDQRNASGQCIAPRDTQNSLFVPSGWMGNTQLYRNVVKPFCRTCHVAMTPGVADFASFDQFIAHRAAIDTFVCSPSVDRTDSNKPGQRQERKMPHAAVTFDQFWLNRAAIAVLSRSLGRSSPCPPPPP